MLKISIVNFIIVMEIFAAILQKGFCSTVRYSIVFKNLGPVS